VALQFGQDSKEGLYKSGETGRFWTFETKWWVKTINHPVFHAIVIPRGLAL